MDYRNIVQTVYKVSDFTSWQRTGSLIISPSFQRRPVWPKPSKSYLLDTIARGFPIPIIFLRERTDLELLEPKREVVDGQQRLRTIFSFIEPALLNDYQQPRDDFTVSKSHNPEIAGLRFNELSRNSQQKILNYKFSVHVLPSDTEDSEVLQIFARMNSTGIKLNRQELRNAEFIGIFKKLAYTLSYKQLSRWRTWKIFSENQIARMLEVEETSDIIQFMIDGLHNQSQPALDKLYKKYEDEFPYEKEVELRFERVMDTIDEKYGSQIADSPFASRVLFNTLFCFFYDLIYGIGVPLDESPKPNPCRGPIVAALKDASYRIRLGKLPEDLSKVLRGGTGNLESRRLRLDFLRGIYKSA